MLSQMGRRHLLSIRSAHNCACLFESHCAGPKNCTPTHELVVEQDTRKHASLFTPPHSPAT
jgi:hypothetical protein